jgi:cytochrome c oxidase cbb3-type subunit III
MNLSLKTGEDLAMVLILALLMVFAIILLITVLNIFLVIKRLEDKRKGIIREPFSFKDWWKSLTGAVPLEKEETILLRHSYDGIRELDNHLPPWWKYMFYATIVFAIIYMVDYHVWKTSPLMEGEYLEEMALAQKEVEAYQAKNAASIDEKTVKLLTDAKVLARGKEIFTGKCAACHGSSGEGGVGPNLTDEYWLHGGSIGDVFKVIKFGIPEKGMISWKATLKPNEIQDVANYVKSISGTNPPNGKGPQGTKSDSTSTTPVAVL